jgi:hypothetical protein
MRLAGVVAVLIAAATTPGCSLLYDLSADQCTVDADCTKFGDGASVCAAGVCVVDSVIPAGGSAPTGGSAGSSSGGGAGEGGAPIEAECETNADCIDANIGQPYLCQSGKCVALKTKECPVVLGEDNLRVPEPIVFGAYALTSPNGLSNVTRNLELVINEFTSKVTGLRDGPDGTKRQLAFVVCNSSYPGTAPGDIAVFEPSLAHLVDTLHVPGIVSAFSAKDLQAVFEQRLSAAGTFVISAFEQDSELAILADGGRLWNMLGATSDLAPTFGPLLKRTEKYLRRPDAYPRPDDSETLRVAVVTADIARETDVRDKLVGLPEAADFEIEAIDIESALRYLAPDVSGVAEDLLTFRPHIIVALAGSEFIEEVIPGLEEGMTWEERTKNPAPGQARPMYILGAAMAPETWNSYGLKAGDGGGWATFLDRVVGVAYASAEDKTLLDAYQLRLNAAQKDKLTVVGYESVYDAGYLMIYAAAAAGNVPTLDGKELARGMRRLIEGQPYDVGPSAISDVLTALQNNQDIGLNLTLGPPNWIAARGTRTGVGSVYCLSDGVSPLETQTGISNGPNNDVLRYDPTTNTLQDKPLLCIPDF